MTLKDAYEAHAGSSQNQREKKYLKFTHNSIDKTWYYLMSVKFNKVLRGRFWKSLKVGKKEARARKAER